MEFEIAFNPTLRIGIRGITNNRIGLHGYPVFWMKKFCTVNGVGMSSALHTFCLIIHELNNSLP
jgi:hypothetical protein